MCGTDRLNYVRDRQVELRAGTDRLNNVRVQTGWTMCGYVRRCICSPRNHGRLYLWGPVHVQFSHQWGSSNLSVPAHSWTCLYPHIVRPVCIRGSRSPTVCRLIWIKIEGGLLLHNLKHLYWVDNIAYVIKLSGVSLLVPIFQTATPQGTWHIRGLADQTNQ